MISTKIHGFLDYSLAVVLIILPFILNFPEGAAIWVPIILGAGTILYSLMTDYEMSAAKIIPMKMHLALDFFAGAFLIATPWLFGFADEILWPFLIIGICELGAALMTSRKPSYAEVRE